MKMKTLISTLATFAAVATAETSKGDTNVMKIFEAPIDQILSITDEKVISYRPEAKLVQEKGGQTITNHYPTVAVSVDGTRGFAFKGPAPVGSLLMNDEGMFVVGSQGLSSEISIGQIKEGTDLVDAVKMDKYNLVGNLDTNALHDVKNVTGYVYGDNVILFSEGRGLKSYTHRAVKISDDKFMIKSHDAAKVAAYRPTMDAQTDKKVYFSDGTDVRAFGMDVAVAKSETVVSDTTVKGLESVNGEMYYATPTAVYNEEGKEILKVAGISGLAKSGSTLYVGTTNKVTKATKASAPATKGGFTPVVIGDAKQIISAKEKGQNVLYKLTMANVLERVN